MAGRRPRYSDDPEIVPAARLDLRRVRSVVDEIRDDLEKPPPRSPRFDGAFGRHWWELSAREQNLARILLNPEAVSRSWTIVLEPLRLLRSERKFREALASLKPADCDAAKILAFRAGMQARWSGRDVRGAVGQEIDRLQSESASVRLRKLPKDERDGLRAFVLASEKMLGRRRPYGARAVLENALAFPFNPRTGEGVGLGSRAIRTVLRDGGIGEIPRAIQKRLRRTRHLRPSRSE